MVGAPASTSRSRLAVACADGSRAAAARAGQRAAGLLIEARVVAADRDGEQVVFAEACRDRRESGRAAAGEEGVILRSVKPGESPAPLVLVLSVSAPPMAKLSTGTPSDLRQRVDIVGAARKAAGRIDAAGAG